MQKVEEMSDGRVNWRQAPYGALQTMTEKGWIVSLPCDAKESEKSI